MATLIPPVRPTVLTGTPSVFLIRVSNARSHPAILDGCEINNDLLELQWFGNTAEIQLKLDSYFPATGDERPEEVAPRVYLDSLQRVEAFRDALEGRVVRGCLRSDEAQGLTRTIAEKLPLPPVVANFIRFGGGATGLVDLTADFSPEGSGGKSIHSLRPWLGREGRRGRAAMEIPAQQEGWQTCSRMAELVPLVAYLE